MSFISDGLRLSPALWENGKHPTIDEYRQVLKRGCMLYSLDLDSSPLGLPHSPLDPDEADVRPCNILYITSMPGYSASRKAGYKGCVRNEALIPHIPGQREYIDRLHAHGIPAIVYQNENNFDQAAFSTSEVKSMEAELDPFAWAFSSTGRRFACYNKPAWRNFLVERLIMRVGETGGDGVFMDNNTPFMHCRCEVCRQKYADSCGGDLYADMGHPQTVVADMRVFDYVGAMQVPKDLVRVDDKELMRYLEWRIDCIIDFHREIRSKLEKTIGRTILYTANGHVGIAEQSALYISDVFDMVFSEDGFTAPPVSNAFNLRLGSSMGEGDRSPFILTRVTESAPIADMVKVLSAEGRALGGQGEFWDRDIRNDEQLKKAQREIRSFYIEHADSLFTKEQDKNDIAVLYSWRSDLWASQAISPAKMFGGLLDDMNLPYDVLIAERDKHAGDIERFKLIIVPNAEVLSWYWFQKIQDYIDNGGRVISTGTSGAMDENLSLRGKKWSGHGYTHFNGIPEKEYYSGRKTISTHVGYERPSNPLSEAVDSVMDRPSLTTTEALPLLTLNHTTLPDGEAFHVINRHVNVFPYIQVTPRSNLTIAIRPAKEISKVIWLSPDNSGMELQVEQIQGTLYVTIPELVIYGVVRVFYVQV